MKTNGQSLKIQQLFLHLWDEPFLPGSQWSVSALFITTACDTGLIRPQKTVSIKKAVKQLYDDVG